jgi:hypothetical protein
MQKDLDLSNIALGLGLLGLQLRLHPVSAGRRLVRGAVRRAVHADRLRTGGVDHDGSVR